SELLTRGLRGGNGLNKKYPWAYVRLFALLLVLFAIFLLIVRFTSNDLFIPTITALASICFNLSFLLFLFELYPKRDLSFMLVCLAMLLGGAGANIITQILYNIFPVSNAWIKAVVTGFFEELPKAASVILIILVSRRNSPLAGFILGAAVGCGFSIVEDMGYILLEANELPVMNIATIVEVSLARGLSALCTHTLWTAAIGWAYCHFTRHFANIAFYLVSLLSCGLHICWDLPLGYVALGFVYAGCTLVACTECALIVHFERRKVFKDFLATVNGDEAAAYDREELLRVTVGSDSEAVRSLSKKSPHYWRHWGNFTVTLGSVLMAITAIIYCSVSFPETYGTEEFDNAKDFVAYMHDGLEINLENRPYQTHAGNDGTTKVDDVLVKVVQKEVEYKENFGTITYNYEYTVSYDFVSQKDYYFPSQMWITIDTPTSSNTYFRNDIYDKDGKLYASYYAINGNVTGYNVQRNGDIVVYSYNPAFERDLSEPQYLALFCVFGGIFGTAAICYISLVIKSWRVKKQCLTETVSSAK
ncbi:MAG: PrsW family intramembrane metalloprotease, partial [Clostridia bacterium]|nr:PrsW family intramembrane metalloprotease [Clostridia bacterium]